MLNARLADDHLCRKLLFTRLSQVFSAMMSFLCGPFSNDMLWRRSRTELSQFLRVFLPILQYWDT